MEERALKSNPNQTKSFPIVRRIIVGLDLVGLDKIYAEENAFLDWNICLKIGLLSYMLHQLFQKSRIFIYTVSWLH